MLVLLGFFAFKNFQPTSTNITIPGIPAQKTADQLLKKFPDSSSVAGLVAVKSKNGHDIAEVRPEIDQMIAKIRQVHGVKDITQLVVSDNKQAAFVQVLLENKSGNVEPQLQQQIKTITDQSSNENFQVERGTALVSSIPDKILGASVLVGVVFALVILFVTFKSLVAAGIPILISVLGVALLSAGLFALSKIIDINSTTPVMGVMLGLAVGIDYSLFIINKYIFYRRRGLNPKQATQKANATAGKSVIFAATTVIIALSSLAIINIPLLTTIGLVGAAGVGTAALLAVSLSPAFIKLSGNKILQKSDRIKLKTGKSLKVQSGKFWQAWFNKISTKPLLASVVVTGLILLLAAPTLSLKPGLVSDKYAPLNSTQKQAYEIIKDNFGEGFNAPLIVLAENIKPVSKDQIDQITQKTLADFEKYPAAPNLDQAAYRQSILQAANDQAKMSNLSQIANQIGLENGVAMAVPTILSQDQTAGIIQVIPGFAPDSDQTANLVDKIRTLEPDQKLAQSGQITLGVTGLAASQTDINQKLTDVTPLYLGLIIGLSFLVLAAAFRSFIIPLKATLGFLLSVGAMFGVIVAVFQWGWPDLGQTSGVVVSFIPIVTAGILFGLAMDYEFFIMSGIQDETKKIGHKKDAVKIGFLQNCRVVAAAALIMAAIFLSFITSQDVVIQAIGLGLGVGVLVDAFLVRMIIIPASMMIKSPKKTE